MRPRLIRSPAHAAAARLRSGRALMLAALLAGMAVSVHADIQEPIEAHTQGERVQRRGQSRSLPANGVPQAVQVRQGESVAITLTADGQPGKTANFIIRSQPARGTLQGPPRQLTRHTASVTYVCRAGEGPGSDTFTYAVQAGNTAVSAAATVTVTILDEPPNLAATPPELDFGAVKTGENTRATLTLENRGGGVATGRVEPPPPWSVDGAVEYHLAHGETQSFQIVFQPPYGRSYVENAHLHTDSGQDVRLIGSGIGPVDPSEALAARRAIGADGIVREGASAPPPVASIALPPPVAVSPPPSPAAVAEPAAPAPAPMLAVDTPAVLVAEPSGTSGGGALNVVPPVGTVVLNHASVKAVSWRNVGTSAFELFWTPPKPEPKSYRVELRYLSLDQDQRLRVDWRPYAKVDIVPSQNEVRARVGGLPPGMRQTVRVVAVDEAGRLAAPSPVLVVETRVASTWWHVTPLKVLIFLLAVCGGLLIFRKWEERQMLRAVDERRAAREADLIYRP